jgi:hypothetical protein
VTHLAWPSGGVGKDDDNVKVIIEAAATVKTFNAIIVVQNSN